MVVYRWAVARLEVAIVCLLARPIGNTGDAHFLWSLASAKGGGGFSSGPVWLVVCTE